MKIYGIVGAGGFGREVMPLARSMLSCSSQSFRLVFVVEQKSDLVSVNGHDVLSVDEFFSVPARERYFNIAIANSQIRQRLAKAMIQRGASPFGVRASNCLEFDDNTVSEGEILCPFTTITSNAMIGKFFHANLYSYIAHDCRIGDYVTFAPSVHCNGNVIIEDHVYVGTGVIIREGTLQKPIVIGKGAVLGMGAVITKSINPYETVVGNPARPLIPKTSVISS